MTMSRWLLVLALACAACDRNPDARGGGPSPATEPIASAWCQHHYACGRISAKKKWADRDACMRDLREKVHKKTRRCEVDDSRVNACLTAIRSKTCDSFRVTTPDACDDLCR
jgi:hypothetical protein